MSDPVSVSERDVHSLLRIVTDEREEASGDGLPWSLLTDLIEQIPSDALSFTGLDIPQRTGLFEQALPSESQDDGGPEFWAHTGNASRVPTPTGPVTCAA